jgi:hypothetical protein
MLLGHGFHALFCQGRPVREDETELERRVRIWWIYAYSGGFVSTTLLDIVVVLCRMPEGHALLGYGLGIFISVCYLLGNVNFLRQMQCRDTLLMHVSAVAKISYGLAFLAVFIIGLIKYVLPKGAEPVTRVSEFAWFIRSSFAVLMVIAACGYRRILAFEYDIEPGVTRRSSQRFGSLTRFCTAIVTIVFAIYPVVLVLVAFRYGGAALWEGLTGF